MTGCNLLRKWRDAVASNAHVNLGVAQLCAANCGRQFHALQYAKVGLMQQTNEHVRRFSSRNSWVRTSAGVE